MASHHILQGEYENRGILQAILRVPTKSTTTPLFFLFNTRVQDIPMARFTTTLTSHRIDLYTSSLKMPRPECKTGRKERKNEILWSNNPEWLKLKVLLIDLTKKNSTGLDYDFYGIPEVLLFGAKGRVARR